MHVSHRLVVVLRALAHTLLPLLCVGAVLSGLTSSASAQARPRAIVLSFEGWHADEARSAALAALEGSYELITEAQAIDTARQIGVDVSSPEGMASVVQHLGIQLVIVGSVNGTGRTSTTTIGVLDTSGNQLAEATAPGPSGAQAPIRIGAAAVTACSTAMSRLSPARPSTPEQPWQPPAQPQPQPEPVYEPEPQPEPQPRQETRPTRSMEEIENERPGEFRGGGGGGGGGGSSDFSEPRSEGSSERWNQPVFRGLIGLDIRSRDAYVLPYNENAPIPEHRSDLGADPLAQLHIDLELRPFANEDDATRGLYARLATWFSGGSYSSFYEDELPVSTFGIEALVGYAGTLAEVVELIGAVGFGYDSYSLELPYTIHEYDFPSVAYPYIPITVGGRVRLLPSSISGANLYAEAMVGPRILLGGGQIAGTADSEDSETAAYFSPRSGEACPGIASCNGDFGGVSGAAVDLRLGLGLELDPGFTAGLRFQYVSYFLGFAGGTGTREAESGGDSSMHIQILLGWSLR